MIHHDFVLNTLKHLTNFLVSIGRKQGERDSRVPACIPGIGSLEALQAMVIIASKVQAVHVHSFCEHSFSCGCEMKLYIHNSLVFRLTFVKNDIVYRFENLLAA